MGTLNAFARRLLHLARGSRFDRELNEEIGFHIETRADELEADGMERSEALLQARREFGPALRAQEDTRSAWEFRLLEDLRSDLRYAARSLRRSPAFAATAIACIALGTGANTAMFSLAKELLFAVPSCREPDSLVRISPGGLSATSSGGFVPMSQYRFIRDSHAFDGVAGMNIGLVVNWRDGEVSYRLAGTHVTDDFFEVTGIPVAIGRPVRRGESQVVVVTHNFWITRLGGDADVLNRTLLLDGKPYPVVGVLPPGHRMLVGFGFTPDLYMAADPIEVILYARLPAGTSREAGYARLGPLCRELDRVFPEQGRRWTRGIHLTPVTGVERLRGDGSIAVPVVAFFAMLVAVTAIVVLIACANVAGLLLARAFGRSHELAVRMSLGGSRGRIVRQLVAESLLLAACGTCAGVLLNAVMAALLDGVRIPTPLPVELHIRPDAWLLAYSAALTVVVALAAGLAPALAATRRGITGPLCERQPGVRPTRLRNALVVGQFATSIVLLSGAFVFLRTLLQPASSNAGFDTEHTVVAGIRTVPGTYTPERFAGLVASALERLRSMPAVETAAVGSAVPLNPFLIFSRANGEFWPDAAARPLRLPYVSTAVGQDYFETMRIGIVRGRGFDDTDRPGSPLVAVLNENLARALFEGGGAVGRVLRLPDKREAVVAGVVRNSASIALGERNVMAIYYPWAQESRGRTGGANFFVRARGSGDGMVREVNALLAGLDPAAAVETRSMRFVVAWALLPSKAGAAVFGAMALFGLALGSIGLCGVLLYSVTLRVPEFGIRLALGARPREILRLVGGETARLAALGLVIGLGIALPACRPLAMFLAPGVAASDAVNLLAVAACLFFAALLGSAVPALRALEVDPAVALRHQ